MFSSLHLLSFLTYPQRNPLTVFVFSFLIILTLAFHGAKAQTDTLSATGAGHFYVQGNEIIDPDGNQFIVKGIDAIYGRFAGGDQNGYGLTNYTNAQRDLDYLKSQGVNLIRLSVSADASTSGNAWNFPAYMQELDQAITWITQRGLIAELSQGETQNPSVAATFLGQLAAKYKDNPLVWIKADNEPFCITTDQSHCNDWAYWQQKHQLYIRAIRSAGYAGPIVINCLSWSWDCSNIGQYPLGDSNLIYGAHMYSNGATDFQTSPNTGPSLANRQWANLSSQYAMMVDEVGSFSNVMSATSQLNWNVGFLDFAADWVKNRGGNGVIAFNFYWSDQNNMSNGQGQWGDWGKVFYDHYLSQISASAPPLPSPVPTAIPTPSPIPTPIPTATPAPTPLPTPVPAPSPVPIKCHHHHHHKCHHNPKINFIAPDAGNTSLPEQEGR